LHRHIEAVPPVAPWNKSATILPCGEVGAKFAR
jgi:hypothetical protein